MRAMSVLEEITTTISSNSQSGALLAGPPGIGSSQPPAAGVGVRL